ncbi:mediator of RNA polymerase II transcription subunit 7 [Pyrenophora tritici-repentis]|uniref:Mediator of RNA polymerase II transcription subunit 7 n=2 Tax=Pyrenophora tritici-repentis TaxID=45151 RepID=A0A2W1FNL0_9PLEO|nr:mediator of RNA polymerase II transcription subunit 7 [Pyrenophora tritici-repentis Pt-1C-BFP]KAA8613698.1 Mediator of RNA polymerase II transcription subunit 7 [Pyrenophora tritici-repentis]EDU49518.1 mediator of RNA polymerase II transcription subunit 7 [Pyrenophora tritici-repentis Pt-1C-BFP]KAF7445419.1 Mediator of RNA polymerase II transcription protein [Pyrenophora tritici-repentis]KAF7565687.1 Med7 multi-domain protein [Pyrenophora tritici-repentis]KAG9380204.1 Mediator of RNA polyme
MADPQPPPDDEDLILSFFPDPPPFYKHFTTENVKRLKEIEEEATSDNDDTKTSSTTKLTTEQILALPTELRYLIPPEPPGDDDEFHVFDVVTKAKGTNVFMKNMEYIAHNLALEGVFTDWTYEQLYPSGDAGTGAGDTDPSSPQQQPTTTTNSATLDRQNYLFRFLRSILLNYISLLGIVASNPTSDAKEQKLKDIMTMVANMHALINEYRPHQARHTLIERMEEQVRRKREEVEGVRRMGEQVREVLSGFGAVDGEDKSVVREVEVQDGALREEEARRDAFRGMWEAADEVVV